MLVTSNIVEPGFANLTWNFFFLQATDLLGFYKRLSSL